MADAADAAEASADEAASKKLPKQAFIIMFVTFLGSMGIYCHNAIVTLFTVNKLGFTPDEVVSIQHGVRMFAFCATPFGALFADSYGNKFIIMLIGMSVGCFTSVLQLVSSIPKYRPDYGRPLLYARYVINVINGAATGSAGGPFIGNQFKLPQQQPALVRFYQITYIVHNVSVLLSFYISPKLKTAFPCLGDQDCYAIGFGLALGLSILRTIVFASAIAFFIIVKPARNMALDIFKCLFYGFTHWIRERKTDPRPHWLDHAEPVYGAQLVEDLKRVSRILIIFSVIPLYEAVYMQLNSKWLLQAARLDGRIGSHTIIPDHFQLLNPFLAIIMLPMFMHGLDPLIARWNMDRLFRRMIFGGTMVVLAFICAGLVETQIKKTYPTLPQADEVQLRIFNGFNCTCVISEEEYLKTIEVNSNGVYTNKHIPVVGYQSLAITVTGSCFESAEGQIQLQAGKSISVHIIGNENNKPVVSTREELVEKTDNGLPVLTVIGADPTDSIQLQDSKKVELYMTPKPDIVAGQVILKKSDRTIVVVPESYKLYWKSRNVLDFNMHLGGIYVVMLSEESASLFTITEPNSVHIAWVIPQSIILIFGEVYYSIAMQEFEYTEAPKSLKVVIAALASFSMGIGNFLIVVITNFGHMDQDHEFYFYAFLLLLDMAWLTFIALRFKSIDPDRKLI